MNEEVVKECIRELDTIKRRLTGLLSSEVVEIFAPPTKRELWEYWKEKGFDPEQAKTFFDHYESNGWKVGKNKMKNWKSAASNWDRRNNEKNKPISRSDRHDEATRKFLSQV